MAIDTVFEVNECLDSALNWEWNVHRPVYYIMLIISQGEIISKTIVWVGLTMVGLVGVEM
jgi:hypothetical protein